MTQKRIAAQPWETVQPHSNWNFTSTTHTSFSKLTACPGRYGSKLGPNKINQWNGSLKNTWVRWYTNFDGITTGFTICLTKLKATTSDREVWEHCFTVLISSVVPFLWAIFMLPEIWWDIPSACPIFLSLSRSIPIVQHPFLLLHSGRDSLILWTTSAPSLWRRTRKLMPSSQCLAGFESVACYLSYNIQVVGVQKSFFCFFKVFDLIWFKLI